jgi:hypothetical protein
VVLRGEEDVRLRGAVVLEVAAVAGVDLGGGGAPVGLLRRVPQALEDVLARRRVGEELWRERLTLTHRFIKNNGKKLLSKDIYERGYEQTILIGVNIFLNKRTQQLKKESEMAPDNLKLCNSSDSVIIPS